MECTQVLSNYTHSEKVCPEQIGFLGISGKQYPILKGPNKIGRDPTACNIYLDSNSISRQHALINVLSKNNFMLMDLGSANSTQLFGQILPPYTAHPIHGGETLQFGEIFGVFRLLKEDDLPMTQVVDIPDTPAPRPPVSRVAVTVPESPDVSDTDDSNISSQPNSTQLPIFKARKFIKPGKTISIQPVGTNKIDNIYWNSSKKSTSLNLDDSNVSLNGSIPAVELEEKENKISNDIHELETQMFPAPKLDKDIDPTYTANTQLPKFDNPASIYTADTKMPSATGSPSIHSLNTPLPCDSSPSIHIINTQLPDEFGSPSIYTLNTQMPGDNLPEVCKINEQIDMQFDLCAKECDSGIHNAETQLYAAGKESVPTNSRNNNDEILFDELDQPLEEEFESQPIWTEDIELPINRLVEPDSESTSQTVKPISDKRNMRINSDELDSEPLTQIVMPRSAKRNMRIKSNDSTDCEDDDIVPSQKNYENKVVEDNTTDCEEDNMIELNINTNKDVPTAEDIEDMPTQVIVNSVVPSSSINDVNFEDMLTQVLSVDIIENDTITKKTNTDLNFEDLPTQVLDEDATFIKQPLHIKQLILQEENSPFKIPSNSPLKAKKKEGSKTPKIKPIKFLPKSLSKNEDGNYYLYTQEVYNDLCTQDIELAEIKSVNKVSIDKGTSHIEVKAEKSIVNAVKNMSNQETINVIGVDNQIGQIEKVPSDEYGMSDIDLTPEKQTFSLMDFSSSQDMRDDDVKISFTKPAVTEIMIEPETENNSENQSNTPVVFCKKKKTKSDAKLGISKKIDFKALPDRVITRIRKPTAKLLDGQNNLIPEMLKPRYFSEQDIELEKDLITRNILTLKSKKESVKGEDIEVNITKNGKRVCGLQKAEEVVPKFQIELDIANDSTYYLKTNEKRKREARNTKHEQDSKNQSSISDKSTNQSIAVAGSRDIMHVSRSRNRNKVETRNSNSPVEIKRSTRIRNAKIVKMKEKSPEKENLTVKPKRKYNRKAIKTEEKKDLSPIETRRSKRQRTIQEEVKKECTQSILKKSVTAPSDESAIYNMSSSSNSDSNCRNKRAPLDDAPSAKRMRSAANNSNTLKAKATNTQYVLFTAFPVDHVKAKLEGLGAVVVTDITQCTVLLTKEIKRTFKLLCCVGLGKPIVGPNWVQACVEAKTILDPWNYLIKDEAAEKRFHFNLKSTLTGNRNFLKGYNVSSTPKVLPNTEEMKLIVECSGGAWRAGGARWVCVSCGADAALWPALRARGATVVSSEFIMGGVLRQRPDIQLTQYK